MNNLAAFTVAAAHAPLPKPLPLFHGTEALQLVSIIDQGHLTTRLCNVFNEELVYLFYGRPAYRAAARQPARSDSAFLPITFLLRPDAVSVATRIYPFDTGAFHEDMLTNVRGMQLDTFELGTCLDIAPKVVKTFFGDNKKYYDGEPVGALSLSFGDFSAEAYYDLVRLPAPYAADDRRFSIEVQVSNSIALEDAVLAVALPTQALDNPGVVDALAGWKAVPVPYHTYFASQPVLYFAVIRDSFRLLLQERGYL